MNHVPLLLGTLLGALAVSIPGCGSDFDPENLVNSVRVLASRVDRPYAAPGDTVSVEVLAFDGRPSRPEPMSISWFPTPCLDPENDGYYSCYPALARQFRSGVDLTGELPTGARFSFALPADVISGHQGPRGDAPYGVAIVFFMACAGHIESAPRPSGEGPEALPFGCFDASHRQLGADAFVFSYTTIFAFTGRTNTNPVIDHLTFDGVPVDPVRGITVPHCDEATIDNCPTTPLDTVVPASSQESDPGNTDATGAVLREQIWVDYLLTKGKMENDVAILFDPHAGHLDATTDKLFAPQVAGDYLLWAVVRDNRGGAAWLQVPLHAL